MRRLNWRGMMWLPCACALVGPLIASCVAEAADDAAAALPPPVITRQVTFLLTFANSELVWQGDPGSPTTSVSIKPGARPLATDVCVQTRTEEHRLHHRSYMREARIVAAGDSRTVLAFTRDREKAIGTIDAQGLFAANDFYRQNGALLPTWPADASVLKYDAEQNALYYVVDIAGPQISESLDFLPLSVSDAQDREVCGEYKIAYEPAAASSQQAGKASLTLRGASESVTVARVDVPATFRRGDVQLGSFDNQRGAYWAERDYRPDAKALDASSRGPNEPGVTFSITHSERVDKPRLVLAEALDAIGGPKPAKIAIDGNFDDWRNVTGVDDPRGDVAPYLDYDPDVDLLEFKVANDDEHIYLYARVAGQIGQAHSPGGRSYFYAYTDVDRNAETGFLPTRDDDCYFGVDIGDDCEVQFEFVDGQFRKAFYGFCGLGGDNNVLKQIVTLGKSQYGRLDDEGHERANYKSEYIFRRGTTEITEDLKLGTSDTIRLAVSPDGHEVEIVSDLRGFLKNTAGRPTVSLGQSIDVAAGMECSGRSGRRDSRWAADSTPAIRGYTLRPVGG